MLSNAYFLAKFRFDTAENEPAKILQNLPILLTLTPKLGEVQKKGKKRKNSEKCCVRSGPRDVARDGLERRLRRRRRRRRLRLKGQLPAPHPGPRPSL